MRAQWICHRILWDATRGRLGRRIGGMPIIELIATGRTSGEPRRVLLSAAPRRDGWVVIASNAGSSRPPSWYGNLAASPRARVRADGGWYEVVAEDLHGEERETTWADVVRRNPGYADYAAAADREIPVVLLRRS